MLYHLVQLSLVFIHVASYGEDCNGDVDCLNYAKALNNAKYPSRQEEVHTLRAIRPGDDTLSFDSTGKILLVRAELSSRFNKIEGDVVKTDREGWYTVYPELKDACSQSTIESKTKRVLQLLGLPPNKPIDTIYEIYTDISMLFRPCPDPEIYDSQCVSEIPVTNARSTKPDAPWYCPSDDEEVIQLGEGKINVANEHFIWMCRTWGYNYGSTETLRNYPWTGLGYTYDWGSSTDGVGLSEFILKSGAEITVYRRYTIDEYCDSRTPAFLQDNQDA
jgi:hypothetical protein